jgi:hypothetical protein
VAEIKIVGLWEGGSARDLSIPCIKLKLVDGREEMVSF